MVSILDAEVIDFVKSEVKRLDDDLYNLQHSIWCNPETGYKEFFAHDTITAFMEKQGWEITKSAFGIETAFLCEFKNEPTSSTPVISYNAEYDALPNIGHACGHNLITLCGVTAAIATALALKKFAIPGTVRLYGTPAEEGGGGKCKLVDAGAWEGTDVSLMAHAFNFPTTAHFSSNATQKMKMEFFGREAHAAASPWQGINALDAMVVMYNAVSVLRQQLLPTDVVQFNISDGGQAPNIITGYSCAQFNVRAPTLGRMKVLQEKVFNCVKAAALATGCKYKITLNACYYNNVTNDTMALRYLDHMSSTFNHEMMTLEQDRAAGVAAGSTDQGNVSWTVPSIHPMFYIAGSKGSGPHTKDFAVAAGLKENHYRALDTAMSLAFIGLELFKSPELLAKVKADFVKDMELCKDQVGEVPKPVENISELEYTE